ncbi:MAG TPA: hypothetical protein VES64_07720, partial [Allosphingosinicella sp.]|nr:hypothetical protein [Allosphingosinicella sp.]
CTGQSTGQNIHQTLAMRLAQRSLLRAQRAERLARLRPAEPRPEGDRRLDSQAESAVAAVETAPRIAPPIAPQAVIAPRVPILSVIDTAAEAARREPEEDAGAALEDFLRALTGGMAATAAPISKIGPEIGPEIGTEAEAGAILRFQRLGRAAPAPEAAPEPPASAPACDLDRLAGAGPGLIWALRRAGLRSLADLAPLGEEELVARLGPLGRLVPAAAWIAAARAAR